MKTPVWSVLFSGKWRRRCIHSYHRLDRLAARKNVTRDYLEWLHQIYWNILSTEFARYVYNGTIPVDGVNGPHGFVYPGSGNWAHKEWPTHSYDELKTIGDTK